ncbi:hypothetical protein [Chitinophaga vietnamensis]|uniref:hypothetical protein n=1 Tax=Chitinophaga vietnamensis TaxID=2593957 RepID=UPI0011779035|nr:hypothetical protein [Chitinophaga vietnamensis]
MKPRTNSIMIFAIAGILAMAALVGYGLGIGIRHDISVYSACPDAPAKVNTGGILYPIDAMLQHVNRRTN